MAQVQLFNRNLLADISNCDFIWVCEISDIDLYKLMSYNVKLPRKIRQLLYMHYDLMKSDAEISAELGISERNIDILLKREVKKMSRLFNPVYAKAPQDDIEKYQS